MGKAMGFRLLIVDDSSSMRAIVKRTVEMSGLEVDAYFQADNGAKALEVLDQEWVDAILTDLNMPVMGGEEFLKVLKENPTFATVPVVVITTEGREDRLQVLEKLGAQACVKKPFQPEEIRDILTRVLGVELSETGDTDAEDDMDF